MFYRSYAFANRGVDRSAFRLNSTATSRAEVTSRQRLLVRGTDWCGRSIKNNQFV